MADPNDIFTSTEPPVWLNCTDEVQNSRLPARHSSPTVAIFSLPFSTFLQRVTILVFVFLDSQTFTDFPVGHHIAQVSNPGIKVGDVGNRYIAKYAELSLSKTIH